MASKLDYTILPWEAITEIAKIMEFGSKKYPDEGWRIVSEKRHLQSLARHFIEVLEGKELDDETGLHVLSHLACRSLMLLQIKLEAKND